MNESTITESASALYEKFTGVHRSLFVKLKMIDENNSELHIGNLKPGDITGSEAWASVPNAYLELPMRDFSLRCLLSMTSVLAGSIGDPMNYRAAYQHINTLT